MQETATAWNESDRRRFVREVEDEKARLMAWQPDLGASKAFFFAAQQVSKERPELLPDFRADSDTLGR